jgi:hypothetical protein
VYIIPSHPSIRIPLIQDTFPEKVVLFLKKGHLPSNKPSLAKQLHLYAPPF